MDVKEASRKTWANKKKSCRKAKATKMRSQFKLNQNCQKQRRELQQNKNLKSVDRVQRRAEIAVQQTELGDEEGLNSHDIHRYQPVQTLIVEEPEPVRMQISEIYRKVKKNLTRMVQIQVQELDQEMKEQKQEPTQIEEECEPLKESQFEKLQVIGKGGFGRVH